MPSKAASKSLQADVLTALASLSTCTKETAHAAQNLLFANSGSISHSGSCDVQQCRATTNKNGRSNAKSHLEFNVVEATTTNPAIQEKILFATSIVNTSLKTINQRLKSTESIVTPAKLPPRNGSRTSPRQLQETSPNRQSKPSLAEKPRSESKTVRDVSSVANLASCAYIAFHYLCTQKTLGPAPLDSPWQLENGLAAFVSKLIALRLHEPAFRGLRLLHQLLEPLPEASNVNTKVKESDLRDTTKQMQHSSEIICNLFKFSVALSLKGPRLQLVINHQLLVLKLLQSWPKLAETSLPSLPDHLGPTVPHSPTNLILRYAQELSDKGSSARQLEALSRIILDLSSNSNFNDTRKGQMSQNNDIARVCFLLQTYALETRLLWTQMVKHCLNVDSEIFKPFIKYLQLYVQRSAAKAALKHQVASREFENLRCKCLKDQPLCSSVHKIPAIAQVLDQLGRLAESAGDLDKALAWHEYLVEATGQSDAAKTRQLIVASRSAVLALKRTEETTDWSTVANLTHHVALLFEGEMHGSVPDLNDLLYNVLDMKKHLVGLLKSWHGSTKKDRLPSLSKAVDSTRRFLKGGLQFFNRSLQADVEVSRSVTSRRLDPKLRNKFVQMSSSFMDTCLLDLNLSSLKLDLSLDHIDEVTSTCLNVLKYCEACEPNLKDEGDERGTVDRSTYSPFVTLSNVYWNIFLASRSNTDVLSSVDIEHALCQSCDLLKDRSIHDKKVGDLPVKLHQLGRTLRSSGKANRARKSFLSSFEASLLTGALREVATLARSLPLKLAWQSNDRVKLLGKSIDATLDGTFDYDLEQVMNTMSIEKQYFEDDERGVLLEWQFLILSERYHNSLSVKKKVSELCRRLLDIYHINVFPVRRLRVLVRASTFGLQGIDSEYEALLTHSEAANCSNNLDVDLYKYSKHLQASLRLNITIQDNKGSEEHLHAALAYWKCLVETAPSKNDILCSIEDIDEWTTRLQAADDFFEFQGSIETQMEILILLAKVYRSDEPSANTRICDVYIRMANACLRSDHTVQAGLFLEKAQTLSDAFESPQIEMKLQTSFTEYFLAIRNLSKAQEHMYLLRKSCRESEADGQTTTSSSMRNDKRQLLEYCDALVATAELSAEVGPLDDAMYYAKKCVSLLRSLWTHLEQKTDHPTMPQEHNKTISDTTLLKHMEGLTLTSDASVLQQKAHAKSTNGPSFWPLLPRLFRCLVVVSNLYERLGMFQDALNTVEEANALTSVGNTNALNVMALLVKGQIEARSGNADAGQLTLEQALKLTNGVKTNKDLAFLHCCFGYVYRLRKDWKTEWSEYREAENILDRISDSSPELPLTDSAAQSVPLEKHSRTKSHKPGRPKSTVQLARSRKATAANRPSKPVAGETGHGSSQISQPKNCFASLRIRILCSKAFSLLLQGNFNEAASIFGKACDQPLDQDLSSFYLGIMARVRLNESLSTIAKDPVCSMLPDATVSVPAVAEVVRSKSKPVNLHEDADYRMSSFGGPLHETLDLASGRLTQLLQVGSPSALLQNLSTFATASMLTSFAYSISANVFISSSLVAYAVDIPGVVASSREHLALQVQQDRNKSRTLYTWREKSESAEELGILALRNFQQSFIDILPSNWIVVSMSISEDRQHLCLIRYEGKQSPFVLRIPLNRQSSHDMEEENFTFDEARSELQEIIQMSDETIHWARQNSDDLNTPGAKSDWWSEREGLDNRLHTLLVNMENLWFGGFQGILSQHRCNAELLARFHQSFESILDKHLPSRQRTFKRGIGGKVALHRKIFELFVALGDRQEDESFDLDEALTDLLYFVVDILQFNGEQNAYDEIDFDSLVVETQDTLKSYLDSARSDAADSTGQHIILIPDKQLHLFPWESMGCLQNKSVSRVLSLADVRDRILVMNRQQQSSLSTLGLSASADSGTYILNPSTDLVKTESRFRSPLSSLNTWTSLIHEPPTSEFFTRALTHSDPQDSTTPNVLLYFGHGSGAQYIRHKSIKRLSLNQGGCNVALLFGCSSASLKEAGEFEPYGTPKSYMIAGAPAVLGSLWDVTDGDTDCFAGKVLERWGLLEEGSCEFSGRKGKEKGAKVRGRKAAVAEKTPAKKSGRSASRNPVKEKLCLSEAVARSRGDCYFKYLNGAAMVVYGVPVFLGS